MPGYKKGQSIRLLSCNTGTLNHGFAQDLANKLNVTVWAQAHICGLILTGNTSLLIKIFNEVAKPDYSKMGRFIKFTPGGNRK